MRGARFGAASGLLVLRGRAIIRLSQGFAPGYHPAALQAARRSERFCFGICGNPVGVNRRSVAFATLLQTSTDPPWYLQQCCKRQPTRRGFCNIVANVNRPAVAFATMLQTSTDLPWYLQQCCKHQPTRRGICNNVANVNRPAVAFATLLQRHAE